MLELGKLYAWSDRLPEALALGKRAIALAPNTSIVHQLYSQILDKAGKQSLAREELLKATAIEESSDMRLPGVMQEDSPWAALADLDRRNYRFKEAIGAISHLIDGKSLRSMDAYLLFTRGEIYEELGEPLKSANDYERGLELAGPDYNDADRYRSRIATLRASTGMGQQAEGIFRSIIRNGKLQAILRIQVFLRNRGFTDVVIDGKPAPALEKALDRCLADDKCKEALGQPI